MKRSSTCLPGEILPIREFPATVARDSPALRDQPVRAEWGIAAAIER